MKIEMQDEQRHEVLIRGAAHIVTTGRVENGWTWYCPHFVNNEGTQASREEAFEAACRELDARIYP